MVKWAVVSSVDCGSCILFIWYVPVLIIVYLPLIGVNGGIEK